MKESDISKALGLQLESLPELAPVIYQNNLAGLAAPCIVVDVVRLSKTDVTLAGGATKSNGNFEVAILTALGEFETVGLDLAHEVAERFPYGLRLPLEHGGHVQVMEPPFTRPGYNDGVFWRTIVNIPYQASGVGTYIPPFVQPPITVDAQPYTFVQASAALVWTVNHNLGWTPQVTVLSLGGSEIEAAVVHTSVNQFTVTFNVAQAGSAVYE